MRWFVLLACLSFNTLASEYEFELDFTKAELEHSWRGPDNYAQFESRLYGLGLTTWRDNIGVRFSYLDGKNLNTDGKYYKVTLGLKYIATAELLYRKEIVDGLYLIGGFSYSVIPIPVLGSTDPHHSTDYDNDKGYVLGVQWRVDDRISVGWKFTHYSRITGDIYDEWTKGHSLNISYKF